MNATAALLQAHPFLAGLPDAALAVLAPLARTLEAAPGTLLCREGAPAEGCYLLVSGDVVLETHVTGRGAVQLESLHGGDLLGLAWHAPPYRWHLDARAVSPVTAIVLDAAPLRAALEAHPALGYAFNRRLVDVLYTRLERARLQRLDVYGHVG